MAAIQRILKMQNTIQPYAWGSRTALAELMGEQSPSDQPQAELWMGAHIKAPSMVWNESSWQPLDDLIEQCPQEVLGSRVAARFGNTLPYLFKILAAGRPLSIQAHPNKQQAIAGFQRETLAGIPLDSPLRNFKDDQHKPECLCALSTFWGMCGFRSLQQITELASPIWPADHNWILELLEGSQSSEGIRLLFDNLMRMNEKARKSLVSSIVDKAASLKGSNPAFEWVGRLNQQYPLDVGVLSPLLLNVIKLSPGEAMYLPARQLHAYLDGLGIEIMANSDNVVRGGLTGKHIEIDELMNILDFNPRVPEILPLNDVSDTERRYECPVEEFALSELTASPDKPHGARQRESGPEIILCIEGSAQISCPNCDQSIEMTPGRSVFVPAIINDYTLAGSGRFYKAAVNL